MSARPNDRVMPSACRWGILLGSLVISACQQGPDDPTNVPASTHAPITATRIASDRVVANVLEYTSTDISEGLAFSKSGDLYVGFVFTGDIVKVARTGRVSLFSNIDPNDNSLTLGLTLDPNGTLYVAVWGFDANTNGVWKIGPDGHALRFAAMPLGTIPNFIIIDVNGDLLITDSSAPGAVWRVGPSGGDASLWVQTDLLAPSPGGFGANGMARRDNTVFVLNYDRGRIVKVPILPDGRAGTPSLFLEDSRLVSADGITFDVQGNMYIGRNFPSSLVRVSPDGVIEPLVDFPPDLPFATNVAFGQGDERKSVYLTIGDLGLPVNVVKVETGIPGAPIQ